MLGFLLLDKPKGITSHDAVARLRRLLGTKRIGHAGTLDPMATGLLIFGIGTATRFLPYLQTDPKRYEFSVLFGIETDSYDAEGETVAQRPVPDDLEIRIREAIKGMVGDVLQTVPVYSAVKKDGRPLYAYARKGQEVERPTRQIHIESLGLVELQGSVAKFAVTCSSGTYVRTIAHEIGNTVGCGAHATEIRRTHAGPFSISDAVSLDAVEASSLIDVRVALPHLPVVTLDLAQSQVVSYGNTTTVQPHIPAGDVLIYGPNDTMLGIGVVTGGLLRPKCMAPKEEPSG